MLQICQAYRTDGRTDDTSADSGGGVLRPGVWHQVRHRARAGGAGQDCGAGGRHGACTSSWPVRPPVQGTQSVMTPVLQAHTASMESASVTQTPSFPRTPRCRTWRRAPIRGRRAGTYPPCWGRCRSSLWCPGGTSDSGGGREQGVMGAVVAGWARVARDTEGGRDGGALLRGCSSGSIQQTWQVRPLPVWKFG